MNNDLLGEVSRLISAGNLKEAMRIVQDALAANNNDPGALYSRAYIHLAESEFVLALRDVERLQALGVESEIVSRLAGKIHYQLRHLDVAEKIFQDILKNNPTQTEALIHIGKIAGFADANYGVRHFHGERTQTSPALSQKDIPPAQTIYSAKNEQLIIQKLVHLLGCRKYCVDIGALDGISFSNTYALFSNGWDGLVFECARSNVSLLAHNLRAIAQDISIIGSYVTPRNVLKLLASFEAPHDFGFLSLDIDSYDYDVLEVILSAYRPSVICAEINERIPPPIKFRQLFSDDGKNMDCGIYGGCSIAAYEDLLRKHGYALVHLEYNNLFAIQEGALDRVAPDFARLTSETAWRIGFYEQPDKYTWMPWNKPFEELFSLPEELARTRIRNEAPAGMVYVMD